MSRSRRTAREESRPAPSERGIFRSPDGGLRGGWLLAASLLCYALVAVGLRLALSAGFNALFRAWGVDAATAHRAPAWAQWIYRWHGSVVTALTACVLVALSFALRRLWQMGKRDGNLHGAARQPEGLRYGVLFALLGLALALMALLLGLIPDSIRPEWPLTAPRFTPALIALCAVALLSTLAEELFTKRVLYDGVRPRWGVGWAVAIACTAHFLVGSGWAGNAVGAVNALLMALLACAVYARYGLWASVGLRFGWSVATVLLFGYGGGEASVYRFYGVSEALLTGGDAGPVYGLWATLLTACVLLWLERARIMPLIQRKHTR